MLKEEKSRAKEYLSVLDGFTLDRQKQIAPQIYQFLLNAIVSVRLSPEIGLKKVHQAPRSFKDIYQGSSAKFGGRGAVANFSAVRDTCLEDQIEAVLESQFICEALECSVARYAARNRNDKLLESLSKKLKDYETALNDD